MQAVSSDPQRVAAGAEVQRVPKTCSSHPERRARRMAPVVGACMASARQPTIDEIERVAARMWQEMNGRLAPPAPSSPQRLRLLRLARAALGLAPTVAEGACPRCGRRHASDTESKP